ncbi:hypothetical protein NDA18_005619 [Ustilago nuda]|nr:hypothetical protein NDA18_005619 [Ustilago nuda]
MVLSLREQPPKKSKLSLFRLGKSPGKPTSSSSASERDHRAYASNTYPRSAEQSTPCNAPTSPNNPRILPNTRQAASQAGSAVGAVHYHYPESSISNAMQQSSDLDEQQQSRPTRPDSLPLQVFVHPADAASTEHKFVGANWPALAKIQTDLILPSASGKHYRTRSHFSIPDVIVTTCEEEGQKQLVQISIPAHKRRSYVLREGSNADHPRSNKKSSTSGFASKGRPAPLIQFDADQIEAMSRSGSLPSLGGSPISPISTTATSLTSPSSSASSSLSKGSTMPKRSRKSSFPMLFARKSLDSARASVEQQQVYVEEPPPFTLTTSASQHDGLLFSSHHGGSVSAPPSRSIFGRTTSLSSPPDTPTSTSRFLTKKEIKAKAKEELALIKELERVDKLVKQHDLKARKTQEKAEAKERKRAAKLAQINHEFREQGSARPSVDTTSSAKTSRKTIFQASTRAAPFTVLARRTSVRGTPMPEVRTFVVERRGSEPILFNASESRASVTTPFSIDLPASERLPFSQPRAAPLPKIFSTPQPFAQAAIQSSAPERTSTTKSSGSSPPRPSRPTPAPPAKSSIAPLSLVKDAQVDTVEAETSISKNPDETQNWSRQSWSELNAGFSSGLLPSLIYPTVSTSTIDEDSEERAVRNARRASVQRVLALSDANGAALQKRVSLRKRGSQQYMFKRRSSHMQGGADARSDGMRSSAALLHRRTLIRRVGEEEGWKVIDGEEECRADESVIAQPDLSATKWDWVEQEEEPRLKHGTIMRGERTEVEVDLVLADLRAAQHAAQARKHVKEGSGERTPTQETVIDPFSTTRRISPPRPNRSGRKEAGQDDGTGHSSSISSNDSFTSQSSGTGTAATMVNDAAGKGADEGMVCFSRPFSSEHQIARFSIDEDKENNAGMKESAKGSKDSQFRLSLALAPLQPLDLFSQT